MIVGFGHRSRMGKDACAMFLETHLRIANISVKRIGFAFQLKMATHQLFKQFGVQHPIHYENHPEDRQIILSGIGTNVVQLWIKYGNKVREVYERTWIDLALGQDDGTADIVIITDVRFPNEAEVIKELGGLLYKVHNPRTPLLDSPSDEALEGYKCWDRIILNDANLEDLNRQMEILSDQIAQSTQ